MDFTQDMVETVAAWRRDSLELAEQQSEARANFFGDQDPIPVKPAVDMTGSPGRCPVNSITQPAPGPADECPGSRNPE